MKPEMQSIITDTRSPAQAVMTRIRHRIDMVGGMLALTASAAMLLAGCGWSSSSEDQGSTITGQAGLALTMDLFADTDIAGMEYTVTQVECSTGAPVTPPVVMQATRDLEDAVLPGGNPDFTSRPFDADSQHLFADAFFWLPQGCYDVEVQPLTADGEPSVDCSPARRPRVPVADGQTTEIMLISQCANDPFGGLDVLVAVNHAPQITNVYYDPSKFTCEDSTTICVTVSDPDHDPLQVTFATSEEGIEVGAITETVTEEGLEVCATLNISAPGSYEVQVTVQDQMYLNGRLVAIEDLLRQWGVNGTSNDSASLPVHALGEEACLTCVCPEGYELDESGEICQRVTQVPSTTNGEQLSVCRGSQNQNYSALGALFPGGTSLQNSFFGLDFGDFNSRLNTIGVWACDANGNPSTQPSNEWIGFSSCIDIPESGSYVIGIAADDFFRVRLNGASFFQSAPEDQPAAFYNFRNYFMRPVELPAGSSILEMEAMSTILEATMGAEIYGPFDPADLADDASMMALDYANNIVWSTQDQLGGAFHLGTNSGFSCEQGYALDLCTGEPVCTLIEREICE